MGMIGEYARLTPEELARVVQDPEWGQGFVHAFDDEDTAEDTAAGDASRARRCDVDKAWHGMEFLLSRAGFPVDIVYGEEEIAGAGDWSYGPPRYLTPAQVRTAAEAMAALPADRLVGDATPADLARDGVYPTIVWERGESLEYVTAHYEGLVPFFQGAARDGDAVLVWIS